MLREFNSDLLLKKATAILDFNLEAARNAKKIGPAEKDKRDLLIYLLWKTGRLSNREIGAYFGLTYSAISRRVKVANNRISEDKRLKGKYQRLKSQIKVWPPIPCLSAPVVRKNCLSSWTMMKFVRFSKIMFWLRKTWIPYSLLSQTQYCYFRALAWSCPHPILACAIPNNLFWPRPDFLFFHFRFQINLLIFIGNLNRWGIDFIMKRFVAIPFYQGNCTIGIFFRRWYCGQRW